MPSSGHPALAAQLGVIGPDRAYYSLHFGRQATSEIRPSLHAPNQEFVWAPDLKVDLARMNAYYLAFPEAERERGVTSFAHLPPKEGEFLTARIYDRFGEHWRRQREHVKLRDRETEKALVDELLAFTKSTETIPAPHAPNDSSFNCHSLTRQVHKRKGNWWQLPKDLPEPHQNHI